MNANKDSLASNIVQTYSMHIQQMISHLILILGVVAVLAYNEEEYILEYAVARLDVGKGSSNSCMNKFARIYIQLLAHIIS